MKKAFAILPLFCPLAFLPGTAPPNTSGVTLNIAADSDTGIIKDDGTGNATGYGEFDNIINVDGGGGQLQGMYVQIVTIGNNLGSQCHYTLPKAECTHTQYRVVEWMPFSHGTKAKFKDTIGLSISGKGCNRWFRTASFYVPASAPGAVDLYNHLVNHYNDSVPDEGAPADAPNQIHNTGIPGHPDIGTGIFAGGVYDADGDGKEDLAGEPLEAIIGAIGESNLVRPGGSSSGGCHYGQIQWNFCVTKGGGSTKGGLGPASI